MAVRAKGSHSQGIGRGGSERMQAQGDCEPLIEA